MSDVCKVCGNKGGHEDWCDMEEWDYNQELRRLAQAVVDVSYTESGVRVVGNSEYAALAAHLEATK